MLLEHADHEEFATVEWQKLESSSCHARFRLPYPDIPRRQELWQYAEAEASRRCCSMHRLTGDHATAQLSCKVVFGNNFSSANPSTGWHRNVRRMLRRVSRMPLEDATTLEYATKQLTSEYAIKRPSCMIVQV